MPDKSIFLTGGTGFVGNAVLNELLSRGYHVRALSRSSDIKRDNVETIKGDLFDTAVLERAMAGVDAVIHLVGIIREHPSRGQTFERIHYDGAVNVIDAARHAGVSRFIHMSALGVREDSPSRYASTKARAEGYLRQSMLDYTILRPSIILGEGGEFTNMMRDWVRGQSVPYVFMPFFGRGLLGQSPAKLQPIRVEDVARAFVDCLDRPELIHKTLDLAGPDQFTWRQMYRLFAEHERGQSKPVVGVPIWYARLLTRIAPVSLLPFNRAQVEMAGEDNTSTPNVVEEHFGWRPEKMPWAK